MAVDVTDEVPSFHKPAGAAVQQDPCRRGRRRRHTQAHRHRGTHPAVIVADLKDYDPRG